MKNSMNQKLTNAFKGALLSEYKLLFCIFFIIIVFKKAIVSLLTMIVIPITSTVSDNSWLISFIFFFLPVITFVLRHKGLLKETNKFPTRYLWELSSLVIYLVFRIPNDFGFYTYCNLDYFTYFFIGLFLSEFIIKLLFKCKSNNFIHKSLGTTPFTLDSPSMEDGFGRYDYVNILLDKILSTFEQRKQEYHECSFTILLSEGFGTGKTSFLNGIKRTIHDKRYYNEVIYIEFKPWLCSTTDSIITEFFSTLYKALSKHYTVPKGFFNSYLSLLLEQVPCNNYTFIFKSLYKKDTLLQEHDRMRDFLKSIDRPIIISIDDVDRLQKDEISIVLKLIRDTADFPNVFYIVAADKQNLCSSLSRLGVKEPEEYLKKFINLDFVFPANDNMLNKMFKERLEFVLQEYGFPMQKESIMKSILMIDNIMDVFNNPRDIVRFFNIFTLAMDSVYHKKMMGEINVADLFAISLIQYIDLDLYKVLRDDDNRILSYNQQTSTLSFSPSYQKAFQHPTFLQLDKVEGDHREEKDISCVGQVINDITEGKRTVLRFILHFIFNQERIDLKYCSMRYPDSYFRYFAFVKKPTQMTKAQVLFIFSRGYEDVSLILKDIILKEKIESFIHILRLSHKEVEDSKIEVLHKLSTFVSLLDELSANPDVTYMRNIRRTQKYISKYGIDELLREIYSDKDKPMVSPAYYKTRYSNKNEKDIDDFDRYIRSGKYDIDFMSIVLRKISYHVEYSILEEENIRKWSKQIIDHYISQLNTYSKQKTFSKKNLYILRHVAGLDRDYWLKSFTVYIENSELFMDWIARVVSYNKGEFEWNKTLAKLLNVDVRDWKGFWKSIILGVSSYEYSECSDLLSLLYTDLEEHPSIHRHPYLAYVKSYWETNNMYEP
jgi:hypothetical protein